MAVWEQGRGWASNAGSGGGEQGRADGAQQSLEPAVALAPSEAGSCWKVLRREVT